MNYVTEKWDTVSGKLKTNLQKKGVTKRSQKKMIVKINARE